MDLELRSLEHGLKANPSDLNLRRRYTRAAIRVNIGHFLVWRGGTGAPPDSDYIEVDQKLFPSQDSPVITQQCQCYGIADLADLNNLLHLQPSGMFSLPDRNYHSFRSKANPIPQDGWNTPRRKGLYAIRNEPLYDTAYSQGNQFQQLEFFQIPIGGSSMTEWPWNDRSKDPVATNMDQGGSLPYPKNFQITGLSIVLGAETPHADAMKFVANTYVRLILGTQDRTIAPTNLMTLTTINTPNRNPLIRFTSGEHFEPTHLFPFQDDKLFQPKEPWATTEADFCLVSQRPFRVQIYSNTWLQFSKPIKVLCVLHGYFFRQVV